MQRRTCGRRAVFLERCEPAFVQEHKTLEVVACRLLVQGERGAHDDQASHQLAAHLRQRTEHMPDPGARCGDGAKSACGGLPLG